jgi:hypothetical protein
MGINNNRGSQFVPFYERYPYVHFSLVIDIALAEELDEVSLFVIDPVLEEVKGNIGINDQADWIAQDNLCTH